MDIYIPRIMMEVSQLWPIIVLFLAMGMILLAEMTLEARVARTLRATVLGFCLLAGILTSFNFFTDPNIDFMDIGLLSEGIVFDRLFLFQSMFLSGLLLLVIIVSDTLRPDDGNRSIFFCLLLASLAGMIVMGATRHVVVLAIGVELASLPMYGLIARDTQIVTDRRGDAGRRYALAGLFSSAMMIFGIAMMYGLTGCLEFPKIALRLAIGGINWIEIVAMGFFVAGLAFKLMILPFGRSGVDAVAAMGTDLGAWLISAGAAAGFVALARVIHIFAWYANDSFNAAMTQGVSIILAVTILFATIGAFRSSCVKRLLGCSSIVHIASLTLGTLIWSNVSGLMSGFEYLIVFIMTTLGAFVFAGMVEQARGDDRIENFRGLGRKNPIIAIMMVFLLLSLIGAPPLAGFVAKRNLLLSLWKNGLEWQTMVVVAAGVLSIVYYLRIVRAMYSRSAEASAIRVSGSMSLILLMCTLGSFALFFYQKHLAYLCYLLLRGFWG
jgi:NADH-quinone oxidoreductase subunit N